jgi:hypothetical protein
MVREALGKMMNKNRATLFASLCITILLSGCAEDIPQEQDKEATWLFPAEKALLGTEPAKFAQQQLTCGLGPFARQPLGTPSDSRLNMSISVADKTMVEGQPLILNVKLGNNSAHALFVNTEQAEAGFQARIFDSSGKFYWGRITRLDGSFGLVLREHFQRIDAGKSITFALPVKAIADFDSPQSHVWRTVFPGSFRLSLCYSSDSISWYDKAAKKQETIPDAWTGSLVSNVLQYEVEKK